MKTSSLITSIAAAWLCAFSSPVALSERNESAAPSAQTPEIRIGIIGTDTSHVTAFTKLLNDKSDPNHVPGARVVAAFKGGSPDVEASRTRIDKFAAELKDRWGVQFVDSIEALCERVDAVLLESVDGRPHLEQLRPVFAAKKRVFVDKPLAASYADAREIVRLSRESGVPFFSSSSLRFVADIQAIKNSDKHGGITARSRSGRKTWSRTIPICSGTASTRSKCCIRSSAPAANR